MTHPIAAHPILDMEIDVIRHGHWSVTNLHVPVNAKLRQEMNTLSAQVIISNTVHHSK